MPASFDLDAVLSSLDPSRSYDVIAGLGGLIGPLNALMPLFSGAQTSEHSLHKCSTRPTDRIRRTVRRSLFCARAIGDRQSANRRIDRGASGRRPAH